MASAKEKTLALLATVNVPFNTTGANTLFVVPQGKTCVLHSVIVIPGADPVNCTVSIGSSGTSATSFLSAQTIHTNVDTVGEAGILQPIPAVTTAAIAVYAAGDVIQMTVAGGGGGATNKVCVFGFLY